MSGSNRLPKCNKIKSSSGVLVHIVNELPGFGRSEMEVVGRAVVTGDVDREPTGACAEYRPAPAP
jgi:hypothetical protein